MSHLARKTRSFSCGCRITTADNSYCAIGLIFLWQLGHGFRNGKTTLGKFRQLKDAHWAIPKHCLGPRQLLAIKCTCLRADIDAQKAFWDENGVDSLYYRRS